MNFRLTLSKLQMGEGKQQDVLAEEALGELANNPRAHGLGSPALPENVAEPSVRTVVVQTADRDSAAESLASALRATHEHHGIRWGYPSKKRTDAIDSFLSITHDQMSVQELADET